MNKFHKTFPAVIARAAPLLLACFIVSQPGAWGAAKSVAAVLSDAPQSREAPKASAQKASSAVRSRAARTRASSESPRPAAPGAAALASAAISAPADCTQSIESLENSILDLSARHWAGLTALPGFGISELPYDPENRIRTPALRAAFKARLAFWSERPEGRELGKEEFERLMRAESRIQALEGACFIAAK